MHTSISVLAALSVTYISICAKLQKPVEKIVCVTLHQVFSVVNLGYM